MAKKPANLVYGVEENPPWGITLLQGLQHVFIMSVYFIFPVIVVHAVGGTSLKWLVIRDYAAAKAATVKKRFWGVPSQVQSREGLSCFGQIILMEPE
jgi:hypothetical protein